MDAEYLPTFEFEGNLQKISLPMLIAHILDERLTGMLHIEAEETTQWIYFEDGFPAGVHAPHSQDFLGSVLLEMGILDDAGFNESLMIIAQTKQLQGEILLKTGKITEEQLEHALSLQLARKLAKMFTLKTGDYRFVEDEDLPSPMEPIRINPYSLILNGIKNCYSTDDLKKGLGSLVGKSCKLTSEFHERRDLFELPVDEMNEVALLREFHLPQDFVRRSDQGTTWAMMMLMALQSCGMLELGRPDQAIEFAAASVKPPEPASGAHPGAAHKPREQSGTRGEPAQRPAPIPAAARPQKAARPATPPKSKPRKAAARPSPQKTAGSKVPRDLTKKIQEKHRNIQSVNLFEVLEVSAKASTEQIKRSFLKLAKTFHPDLVASSGDKAIIDRMDEIFARLNEAHEILTDPKRRMEYERALAAENRPTGARPQEARIHYEKTLVFYKKKDYHNAAKTIQRATELDPENADYLAYQAWIDFQKCEQNEANTRKTKSDLYQIVRMNKKSFPAVRFLSLLYNKLGDMDDYEKCLLMASRLNSKDIEVTRELRLLQTRKKKAAKHGRFLGIKFKK
jgi:tetratricopeptide (TPR) repeat protein